MVRAETLIYDKDKQVERPVAYGDMALLFQSMTHVTLYEEVFKALNLPFVTVAGRGYDDRQEVWDMINLLTALHNPAVYEVHTDLALPLTETILPVARRMFVKYLAAEQLAN